MILVGKPKVNFVDGCLQSMLLLIVAITPTMGPGSATAIENFHEGQSYPFNPHIPT